MPDVAPVGDGGGKGEEDQVAARQEGVGQPVLRHGEGHVLREAGAGDGAQSIERDDVIFPEPFAPGR